MPRISLDAALSRRDLGGGLVWNGRDPGGAFYGTALCPWSGIPSNETTLAGVWALGFDHDRTASAWRGGTGSHGRESADGAAVDVSAGTVAVAGEDRDPFSLANGTHNGTIMA